MNSLLLGAATVSDIQLLSRDPFPPPEKPGAGTADPRHGYRYEGRRVREDTQIVGRSSLDPGGTEVNISECNL